MSLEFYYREDCPYSRKVRGFIADQELGAQIKFHDVDKDKHDLQALVSMNHSEQVPCLFIDGKPMLESDQIIGWLGEHANDLK